MTLDNISSLEKKSGQGKRYIGSPKNMLPGEWELEEAMVMKGIEMENEMYKKDPEKLLKYMYDSLNMSKNDGMYGSMEQAQDLLAINTWEKYHRDKEKVMSFLKKLKKRIEKMNGNRGQLVYTD